MRNVVQAALSIVMPVAFAGAPALVAQPRPEPRTAEEVFQRHIEAIGGEQALRAITSRRLVLVSRMKISDTLPEMESRTEFYYGAPDRFLMRMYMGPMVLDWGVSAGAAWVTSAAMGTQRVDSATAAHMIRSGMALPSLSGSRVLTLLGKRSFGGRPAWALRISGDSAALPATEYYDVESGLRVATVIEMPPGAGGVSETRYEDYRWFGPERVPVTTWLARGGVRIGSIKVKTLEHKPLDPKIFTAPKDLASAPMFSAEVP